MPEHFGRLNMSHATGTQADRMVETIWDWLAAHPEAEFDFPASELHRRIGRVVYGGVLLVRLGGEDYAITREAVLAGLPSVYPIPSSENTLSDSERRGAGRLSRR